MKKQYIDKAQLECISYHGTEGRPDTFDEGVKWVLEYIDKLPTYSVKIITKKAIDYSDDSWLNDGF